MTKTKSTTTKHKTKPTVDEVVEQPADNDMVVLPVVDTSPTVTPKERLLVAAAILAELLPTYSGPGRRYIEAARINIDQAIRYTP